MKILTCLAAVLLGLDAPDASSIGTSRGGRPLELIVLADPIEEADQRPAILLVAGLDGRHTLGPLLLEELVQRLRADHTELLSNYTFYVLPQMNPDAAAANAEGNPFIRKGTARVIDQDRDGLIDEDPPRDMNGDGMITLMRRTNPTLERPNTHLVDPGEERLMKTPNRKKGEIATYSISIEGTDADGDGLIGEDGPEGVDLNRNFMHLWPEHQIDAGPYPLSEYESRALAEFVLAHPNIVAAVVYGPHDNLVHEPNSKDKDITGRIPKELNGDDKEAHLLVSEQFKKFTEQKRSARQSNAGSLHGWLYAHRGIPTYASTGWGRPKPSELPGEQDGEAEGGAEGEDEAQNNDQPEAANKEDAQWLAYSDRDRQSEGHIEWTEFDHPQLGIVEIGGWAPGFQMNPPTSEVPALAQKHAKWIAHLASMQPKLVFLGPATDSLGHGVTRIRFAVRNEGTLPTRSAQATQTRANLPTLVKLVGVPDSHILQGNPVVQINRLKSGEEKTIEWLVRLGPEDHPKVNVEDQVLNVALENTVEVHK